LLWIHSEDFSRYIQVLREGLQTLGHAEGKTFRTDDRSLVSSYERLSEAAARLVSQKVDVIVTYGATAAQTARKATSTVPIVAVGGGDWVKLGLVGSLSRPGGNLTGLATLPIDISAKRLELLKEIVPALRRLAVVLYSGSAMEIASLKEIEAAARTLNLETRPVDVGNPDEIESAIAGIGKMNVQAVLVVASTMFVVNHKQVVASIAKLRVPAIHFRGDFVESGGLISYGVNLADQFRRAAVFVDKILKGAKPSDLPVEQSARFELIINQKTAKALGITIPQSILVRADRVIE
jgi:putative ABC transport system substrate-binding protein